MPQYELKTDSSEFEVANTDQSSDATDLVIRLWGRARSEGAASLSWKTDSVLVYMIADLVSASRGRIAEESPAILGAHFASSSQAMVAAKRIQTSMLEFVACRPDQAVAAAILLYGPGRKTSTSAGFSAETAQQARRQAKPGQILLAQNAYQRLRDLPGVEFRRVPALSTVTGDRLTEMSELVWTSTEQIALFQDSFGDEAALQSGDVPLVGATVMVRSPFSREEPSNEGVQPAVVAPVLDNVPESPGTSSELSLEEFARQPFFTRTRMFIGVAALVLAAALIAVLNLPVHVAKLPVPVRQDLTDSTEIPEKSQATKSEPEAAPVQQKSSIAKTEIEKPATVKRPTIKSGAKLPLTAQPQLTDQASVDNRVRRDPET